MNAVKSPTLTLYHYRGCPFCSMVERSVDQLGLQLERRDIHQDEDARRELVEATGRQTVPVLKISEGSGEGAQVRWMPESRDIIRWLQQEYG